MKLTINKVLSAKPGPAGLGAWIEVSPRPPSDPTSQPPIVVLEVTGAGGQTVRIELTVDEARQAGEIISFCGSFAAGGQPPIKQREDKAPILINGGS